MDVVAGLIGLVSGTLSPDDMKDLLGGVLKSDFTAWSAKITIVWWLMRGKVQAVRDEFSLAITSIRKDFTDHFSKIEKGFSDMVGEMKELKENVTRDLAKHSETLAGVTQQLTKLTIRVDKLETKKED